VSLFVIVLIFLFYVPKFGQKSWLAWKFWKRIGPAQDAEVKSYARGFFIMYLAGALDALMWLLVLGVLPRLIPQGSELRWIFIVLWAGANIFEFFANDHARRQTKV